MVNVVIAGSSGERRLSLYFIVCWAGAGREGAGFKTARLEQSSEFSDTSHYNSMCVCVCVYLLNCT